MKVKLSFLVWVLTAIGLCGCMHHSVVNRNTDQVIPGHIYILNPDSFISRSERDKFVVGRVVFTHNVETASTKADAFPPPYQLYIVSHGPNRIIRENVFQINIKHQAVQSILQIVVHEKIETWKSPRVCVFGNPVILFQGQVQSHAWTVFGYHPDEKLKRIATRIYHILTGIPKTDWSDNGSSVFPKKVCLETEVEPAL